jgi:acyl-coenzyme A thioesterase PaaI-like protein
VVTSSHQTDNFFQKYMPGDVCFGCGHSNADGLQIKSYWEGDNCVCVWQPEKKHQGWPDITCGGILATLIDCHCMASAMATAIRNENRPLGSMPEYRFATGTLHIKYLKPTPSASLLTLSAKVIQVKDKRIYTLHCDLFAENIKTVEADITAFQVYSSDQKQTDHAAFNDL